MDLKLRGGFVREERTNLSFLTNESIDFIGFDHMAQNAECFARVRVEIALNIARMWKDIVHDEFLYAPGDHWTFSSVKHQIGSFIGREN